MAAEQETECHMVEDGYLSEQFIKKLSGDFDISCVIHIYARNTGVENLGCVYMCEHLVFLDVSCNRITDLSPLYKLQSLQTLDLNNNKISSLRGLEEMPSLTFLNISGNELTTIDSLKTLETIPTLRKLVLKDGEISNPICHSDSYPGFVKTLLPDLIMLDYRYLKGELSSVFKKLDFIEEALKARRPGTEDLPVSKPLVSAEFWEDDMFDDIDLKMKLRYLKETVNSVYVERYRVEDMMTLYKNETEQALRKMSVELTSPLSPSSSTLAPEYGSR